MKCLPCLRAGLAFLLLTLHPQLLPALTPGEEMAAAAKQFLAALTPDQRAKAQFDFKNAERENWHFIPRARQGLPFKEMTAAQTKLAHAFLSTGLSQRGYVKAATVMSLEQILHELEAGKGQFNRDPDLYYFSLFGPPGADAPWGWRVEGHHLAINFTLVQGRVIASTPSFLGSNPAEVRSGDRRGLRALAAEEDLARQLVHSLSAEQRQSAIYSNTAPADILTVAERRARRLGDAGLSAARMNGDQRQLLQQLIEEYVRRVRPELADADLARIEKAGLKKVLFAWAGGTERGQGHYYRVQGPTFLLEYDNTQNNANHIHAVWRDFENDFGDDILARHYREAHDKK